VEFDKWFGRGLTTIASFPGHTHHNPCFRDYGDQVATHSTGIVTPKQTRTLTTSSTRNVKGGHEARQHCVQRDRDTLQVVLGAVLPRERPRYTRGSNLRSGSQ
jgi:hypothetical protein